jgi:hypothetical protein
MSVLGVQALMPSTPGSRIFGLIERQRDTSVVYPEQQHEHTKIFSSACQQTVIYHALDHHLPRVEYDPCFVACNREHFTSPDEIRSSEFVRHKFANQRIVVEKRGSEFNRYNSLDHVLEQRNFMQSTSTVMADEVAVDHKLVFLHNTPVAPGIRYSLQPANEPVNEWDEYDTMN